MALTQVSTNGVKDGSLLNADINSSAAIAVSKLANFVTNNADNRVITGSGTANTLEGEANLTFDGSTVTIGANAPKLKFNELNDNPDYFINANAGELNIHDDTNGSTKLTITSTKTVLRNNNIGLGTTTPNLSSFASPVTSIGKSANPYSVLELQGNNTSDGAFGIILGYNSGGSARTTQINFNRQAANNSGSISFETASAGSLGERVRITNDGLTFNGDTAAANALNDYEEGTWTPTTTRWSVSESTSNAGKYTRIGNFVQISWNQSLTVTNGGYNGGGSGAAIGGLPFTVADCIVAVFSGSTLWTSTMKSMDNIGNEIFYRPNQYSSAGVATDAMFNASGVVKLTATYRTS